MALAPLLSVHRETSGGLGTRRDNLPVSLAKVCRVRQEWHEALPNRTPVLASVAICSGDLSPILWHPPQPFIPSVMDIGW